MALSVYRPSIRCIYITVDGERIPVAGETFSVQNITASSSLGTLVSDSEGYLNEGSFTADIGDIVELSHATYPGLVRYTLQATQEKAYTAPENDVAAYIVQNNYTATNNSTYGEVYYVDTDTPDMKPVHLARVQAGITNLVPYQTAISRDLRLFLISQDDEGQFGEQNFDYAEFDDITVPGLGSPIDGSGAATRIAYWSDADTLASSANLTFNGNSALIATSSAAAIPLIIKGATSQTADLQEWHDSAGIMQAAIGPTGLIDVNREGLRINAYDAGAGGASGTIKFSTTADFRFSAPIGVSSIFSPAGGAGVGVTFGSDRITFGVNTSTLQIFGSGVSIGYADTATPASGLIVAGDVGIGTSDLSARLHIIKTTEQLRVGYDASNYFKTTIGSTGSVTFDAVGSGAKFTFNDDVEFADGKNIIANTTTGSKIGTTTTQKLGFWGQTPVALQTVNGARNNPEAALADLIAKLEIIGIIADSTTAT